MPDWLQWISNVLPASYALEALQQVGAHTDLTATAVRDIAIVVGLRGRGAVPGRGDAAAAGRRDGTESGASARPARPAAPTPANAFWTVRESCSRATGSTRLRSARSPPPPASTPRWCITTSAPRSSCSPPPIHIPIDPMQVIGPMRETPVEELGPEAAVAAAAAVGLRDWAPASSPRCARCWRATRSAWCGRSCRR